MNITLNEELEQKVRAYIERHDNTLTLEQACEQLMLRGLSEDNITSYKAPSEDEVKERLKALGYIE